MQTVPANNLFTISILHCFLVCKEPLYQENLKLDQSDKRGKNESGNKKYAKNDFFLFNGSFWWLKFIFSATRDLNHAIDFFEEKSAHIHNTSDKLEQILCTQYRKVLDESELSILNDDTDELVKKSKKELVNIDLDKA